MFSYGPFFHTGVKAEYTAGKSGFMLGILNPTDLKSANFQQKMIGAQYSFAASDKLKFYLNYMVVKLLKIRTFTRRFSNSRYQLLINSALVIMAQYNQENIKMKPVNMVMPIAGGDLRFILMLTRRLHSV